MKKLVIIFILLFYSTAANAQFSGGDGSESNPYLITTAAELAQLATYVNAGDETFNACHYKLGANIDLFDYQSGQGWMPIGTIGNNCFRGVFDGNNKKITGLKINNPSHNCVGLFGMVIDGKIINLGIENANISGLSIANRAGIVAGHLDNCAVSNCYATGTVSAHSNSYNFAFAGGFAGSMGNSIISNCYTTGTISAHSTYYDMAMAGGFAGFVFSSIVSNCYATGIVNANASYDAYAGGFVGRIDFGNTISNCYSTATANANSTDSYATSGGITGYIYYSTLTNCYSTGKVSAKSVHNISFAGGVSGNSEASNISHCVAINPAVLCSGASEYFGRIVGYKLGTISSNLGFADMYNNYGNEWLNIGEANLDGESISKEQIIADGTLGNIFTAGNGWTTQNGKLPGFGAPAELPDFLTEPTVVNITVLPTKVYMKQGTTQEFEAHVFIFNNAPTSVMWSVEGGVSGTGITQNGVLTVAHNETARLLTVVATSTFDNTIKGTATVYVPYVITTAEELAQVATYVNSGNSDFSSGYFILGNDIDLSNYQEGSGWTPIGNEENSFMGIFDGNHKKITGLKINTTAHSYAGLFGYVYDGTINNLGIENADIYRDSIANNNTFCAGILAGRIHSGVVSDCYATGTVSYNSTGVCPFIFAGGLAGIIEGSTISNFYSTGTIYVYCNSSYVEAGGLTGEMQGSKISNCYSTASVTVHSNYGSTSSGGLAGDVLFSTITNCYATGSVSTNMFAAGGIVGEIYNSTVSNCAAFNSGITSLEEEYGRVVGSINSLGYCYMISNIAFTKMVNPSGNTTWNNIGASNKDGENISCDEIHADGTFGGRFTSEGGWTTQNGKLPGLFGNVVDLPKHLWCAYPIIISSVLQNGTVNVAYSATLEAIGDEPIIWNIEAGSLPTGLTLYETTGEISGTPTVAGMFYFTVKATNEGGSDTKQFTILIHPAPLPPTIITNTLLVSCHSFNVG